MAYCELLGADFILPELTIAVAYGLGIVLYLIAAGALYAFMTNSFDRLAGRCGDLPEGV